MTQDTQHATSRLDSIIDDPEAYGFRWGSQPVQHMAGDYKVKVGDAPRIVPFDVDLFEKAFPGKILEAANGTSISVSCDNITRPMLKRDKTTDWREMQVRLVQWLLKITTRTRVAPKAKMPRNIWDLLTKEQQAELLKSNPQGITLTD